MGRRPSPRILTILMACQPQGQAERRLIPEPGLPAQAFQALTQVPSFLF